MPCLTLPTKLLDVYKGKNSSSNFVRALGADALFQLMSYSKSLPGCRWQVHYCAIPNHFLRPTCCSLPLMHNAEPNGPLTSVVSVCLYEKLLNAVIDDVLQFGYRKLCIQFMLRLPEKGVVLSDSSGIDLPDDSPG